MVSKRAEEVCKVQSPRKIRRKVSKQDKPCKKQPPQESEPHTKTVNNKTYNWCKTHKAWTYHRDNECRLKNKEDKPQENEKRRAKNNKNVQRARTLAAICDELSDSNDDDTTLESSQH